MNIGLYFGSFNPVHVGHLIIANHILNEGLVQKIWWVVSPQNPHKPSNTLLNEYNRLHLLNVALTNDNRMLASDVEFNLPKPSFTAVTLAHLKEKHPDKNFKIIMGSDSFNNLPKWKNPGYITDNFEIIVYNRPGYEADKNNKSVVVNAPLLQISATEIRQLIAAGKSIKYLVPDKVIEEVEAGGYYKIKNNL